MAAGDLIVADYQVELRALLMGATTNYELDGTVSAITGLGVPPIKSQDTDLAHADGVYGGRDYRSSRVITVALNVTGASVAATFNNLTTLNTAWAPAETTNVELHFQLPGWGHVKVSGRPRGLDVDLTNAPHRLIRALGTFVALTPTITSVP